MPTDRRDVLDPTASHPLFYMGLAAVFIAALVACNLIFQKFFLWEIGLGTGYRFQQSVGLLAYPVTFLVTDILSEVFGKRAADRVVTSGLMASLFVTGLVIVGSAVPATGWSPVDDVTFDRVFGLQWVAVTASMTAYLGAQYLDIRLFHFWKRLTRGKHLWLRNNASTITSQVADTAVVNGLLAALGGTGVTWERFPDLFWNGLLFKWVIALLDTPFFYAAVWFCRRRLGIPELETYDEPAPGPVEPAEAP